MMGSSRCPIVLCSFILISRALSVPDDIRTLCPRDIALDPQYVWIHGSSCLQLSLDKHDWPHARERCQRHGGDLVQIRTADMQGSIIEKIRQIHHHIKVGFWIGASDQHHEGRWEWVSGDKTMTYDNWSPHQGPHQAGFLLIPGGGTEDCGLLKISDNYMWHDYPCHSGIAFFYPYICQFDIPHTTKSLETTLTPRLRSSVATTKATTEATTQSTTKVTTRGTKPMTKLTTKATTKLTTQTTTKSTAKTTIKATLSSTALSTTKSTTTKSTTTKPPTVNTAQFSLSAKSTLLSLLTLKSTKSTVAEKTNVITLFPKQNTPEKNPSKRTTGEWEELVTEQGQSSTTTARNIPEGMVIIG